MKIIHIMFADKFVKEYIDLINKNFHKNEHEFFIFKTDYMESLSIRISEDLNVKLLEQDTKVSSIAKSLDDSDKIIIHGLFLNSVLKFLFLNSKYLNKCNWVIWGGDLYQYKFRKKDFKSNIYEFIRKFVIKNFLEVTALIKGDYEIAKKVYKTKARYCYAFYPNPINFRFLDNSLTKLNKKNDEIVIQVGNSAAIENEHVEIFNILSKFKGENIKILCPLSYGDKKYSKKIVELGKEIFREKFYALTEYLSPEDYSKVLANVDIAIFNHRRQQALGNTIALLYMGKKVYIRSKVTTWEYFRNLGVGIYDIMELEKEKFDEFIDINRSVVIKNKDLIKNEFSEENCVKLWEKVFLES